jgi:hypothetical protein
MRRSRNRYTSSRRVEGSNPSPSAEQAKNLQSRDFIELDTTLNPGLAALEEATLGPECASAAQRADRMAIAQAREASAA